MEFFSSANENQFVIMSKSELEALINKMTGEVTATLQRNSESHICNKVSPIEVSDDERFITRDEAAKLLHVDLTTLWRWNKNGFLRCKKVGLRRVMYKYKDVLNVLNGNQQM